MDPQWAVGIVAIIQALAHAASVVLRAWHDSKAPPTCPPTE